MANTEIHADHIADWVILKNDDGDIIAKLEPEVAVKLSQDILDVAGKALNGAGDAE